MQQIINTADHHQQLISTASRAATQWVHRHTHALVWLALHPLRSGSARTLITADHLLANPASS
jgi:hypothetical protein